MKIRGNVFLLCSICMAFTVILLLTNNASAGDMPYWYANADAKEHLQLQRITRGERLDPTLDTVAAGIETRLYDIDVVHVKNVSTSDTLVVHVQCTSEEQAVLNVYTVGMTLGIVELAPGEQRTFILPLVDHRAIFISRRGVSIGFVDITK